MAVEKGGEDLQKGGGGRGKWQEGIGERLTGGPMESDIPRTFSFMGSRVAIHNDVLAVAPSCTLAVAASDT